MSEFAAAEAVFGSASRCDSDSLSDRDILIVDSDTALLRRRQEVLEKEGWSVASYTFLKLGALARRGVLFVQHLKAESSIIKDDGGALRAILDSYKPKVSYISDLDENARLANLITFRPDCHAGCLWAADVLYVATRNFGILTLAQAGQFIFSYSKMVHALAADGIVDKAAVVDLLSLRIAKASYRSDKRLDAGITAAIIERALDSLPDIAFPRRSAAISPMILLSRTRALPAAAPCYHRLRHLERAYLAVLALHPSRGECGEYVELMKWIENPRAYAFFAATQESSMIDYLQRMAKARALSCNLRGPFSDSATFQGRRGLDSQPA